MGMGDATTDRDIMTDRLAEALTARGIEVSRPATVCLYPKHPACPHLQLAGGGHVHVARDCNGYWQAEVFDGPGLVAMADADGSDWPGDPA